MSLIVAARFDTFDAAEAAAHALFQQQFLEEDVNIFFVNPPGQHDRLAIGGDREVDPDLTKAHWGAAVFAAALAALGALVAFTMAEAFHWAWGGVVTAVGALVGAYGGSLIGAMQQSRKRQVVKAPGVEQRTRHAGVLLAVNVQPEREALATTLLRSAGGQDVEKATGRWKQGKWVDFDALRPPVLAGKGAPYGSPQNHGA